MGVRNEKKVEWSNYPLFRVIVGRLPTTGRDPAELTGSADKRRGTHTQGPANRWRDDQTGCKKGPGDYLRAKGGREKEAKHGRNA